MDDAGEQPAELVGLGLGSFLRSRGTDDQLVRAAEAAGPEALTALAQQVVLLGAPATLRPVDVWAGVGADPDLARGFWRAMGFAHLPDDAAVLAPVDADALASITGYLESGAASAETAIRFTRLLGQTMSRVADALLSIVDETIHDLGDLPESLHDELLVLASDSVLPLIEQELTYLLRRHLLAGVARRAAVGEEADTTVTIGFADVVSFTRLSGQLPEEDLAQLLEDFEAITGDLIAEGGGRVVKLIGDAVLFVVDDPAVAVDIALGLVSAFGGERPDLRVGLARGPIITRQGDVFGAPVNLASRLVGYARPGTVLADEAVVDGLGDDALVSVRSLRPRELKGLGTQPMYVLRREG